MPASAKSALALSALLVSLPGAALAEATAEVSVTLNEDGVRLAQELGFDAEGFERDVEDKVAHALQLSEVQRFLRSFANATSFSNRGLGVEYASNGDQLVVGFSTNLALSVDLEGEGDDDLPTVGIAPNFALTGALNLGRWNLPKLTAHANLFHYRADSGALHGGITSAGLHLQYKFFTPTRGNTRHFVRWGGLDLTSGVEIAYWNLGLGGEISHDFTYATELGLSSDLYAAVGGRFDVSSTTFTFPIELTTSVRFLHVLSFYTGMGIDLGRGEAEISASTFGTLRATRPSDPEIIDTIGDISASASGSNTPSRLGYHLLLGAQLNVWRIRLYTQMTLQPISDISLGLGARVAI